MQINITTPIAVDTPPKNAYIVEITTMMGDGSVYNPLIVGQLKTPTLTLSKT